LNQTGFQESGPPWPAFLFLAAWERFVTQGLLCVYTGDGKGKTTAALGMVLRALGQDLRCLVLQFIKGAWAYGELTSLGRLENVRIQPLGTGFTWRKESLDEDRRLALAGWELAAAEISRAEYDLIVLDEINIVLSYGLLPVEEVVPILLGRPEHLHIVCTGRNAPDMLLEAADLVTEMRAVKHPYRDQGIKAQRGIEF
jgi:cob(I)alamin adenosyltransferase